MEKIPRKQMAHFLQIDGAFLRLGQDLEEFTPKITAKTEITQDILGQPHVLRHMPHKQGTVQPCCARVGEPLFELLQQVLDGRKLPTLWMVEARLWKAAGNLCPAVWEECFLEITSYGGDGSGYRIWFNIHYTGSRHEAILDLSTLADAGS